MRKLFFLFAFAFIIACNNNKSDPSEKENVTATEIPGKDIYKRKCSLCHGSDGTLGLSGAANLSISLLTTEEKVVVITNGRKAMMPYKDILTPEQIREVAEYTNTFNH
jgi:mono/diheme cytochrome c family protein